MAMRIRMGHYDVEEAKSRHGRWFALVGGAVVALVAVGSQGFSAGSVVPALAEPSHVDVCVPVPTVLSSASWRSSETASPAKARREVYRQPVLLEEIVNPRIYENLQGIAICPVGAAREWEEPHAVRALFRAEEAEVTHVSKARSGGRE